MLTRPEDPHFRQRQVDPTDHRDLLIGVTLYIAQNEGLSQGDRETGHSLLQMFPKEHVCLRRKTSTMKVLIKGLILASPGSQEIQTDTTSDGKEPRLDVGRPQIAMVLIHANERLLEGVSCHRFVAGKVSAESVDRALEMIIQAFERRTIPFLERFNYSRKVGFVDSYGWIWGLGAHDRRS